MTLVKHFNPKSISPFFDEIFYPFPTSWGSDTKENVYEPAVNIIDSNEGYHVEVSVPGIQKEDLNVSVEKNTLTISFEKKNETEQKEGKLIRREFAVRSFKSSFLLDDKIAVDKIEAKFENGILKLNLPKKEEMVLANKAITIQ